MSLESTPSATTPAHIEALRESERRFRAAFQHAGIGMALADAATGRVVHANAALLHMLGCARDEIDAGTSRGNPLAITEQLTLDAAVAAELRATGRATPFEKEYVRGDGSSVPMLVGGTLLASPGEALITTYYLDLTERRLAARRAEALQRITSALSAATTSEAIGRIVATMGARFAGAAQGVLAMRDDGNASPDIVLVGANAPGESPARLPLDAALPLAEAVRHGIPLLFENRDQLVRRFPAMARVAAERGIEASLTLPIVTGGAVSGAVSFTHHEPVPVSAATATHVATLVGIVADALERVRLYEALRRELVERERAEAEFRALADSVVREQHMAVERAGQLQRLTAALGGALDTVSVARVIMDEGVAAFGACGGRVWLLSRDGTTLQPPRRTAHGDEQGATFARIPMTSDLPVTEVVRGGTPLFATARDDLLGRWPQLASMLDREQAAAAALLPLVVEARTVGALILAYPAARRFGDEDRSLLDAFARQCALAFERARLYEAERAARAEAERARADAELASRSKSEFLAVMSHELRTPLNAISGHVELLEMGIHGTLSPSQLDALGRVTRAQRHLLALINDVLNFSRIEAGKVEYDLQRVDVGDVIASIAAMIEPQLAARQLAYVVQLPAPAPLVRADRDKLQQVLLNLLSNAAKYTDPGGRVVVDVATRAGTGPVIFLRVRDTGCGIPREKLESIFEPFVRVEVGHTRRTDGAGLGLAIARDLARGMGGDLRARSAPGQGSTFTVALPSA